MHIPLCHAERGQKGPSATDLEQSGLGESINTNRSKRKVQLMLIMKIGSVLHCWDKHFLDSKYKYLLDLKHYICQWLKMSNQPGLKTNRNLIRKVSAQSPAQEGVIGFIYFCKYGCSYDMPVTLCTAKWNVGLEVEIGLLLGNMKAVAPGIWTSYTAPQSPHYSLPTAALRTRQALD